MSLAYRQIRYGCNPFCFSTCNSIKFGARAFKLLHKIPTFVSYKWHLFKAQQECHRPCVLTLNTLHFFFTICPNIWVGCNTCWGDRQKLDKRNKKGVHTREHASKKGVYWNTRRVSVCISLTDHNVFCYINYASLSLSYLVWGVAEDFKNKMSKYQPCAIRNRGA